jgi:LPPG:FO 2-phospho-L-lactate transferase
MRVVVFAGGVGGAKLVDGMAKSLPPGNLTAIVNTGDDFRYYGLAVSPDLDTVMYTLAGLAHPVNGWGLEGDTRQMLDMLARYGEAAWFGTGDKDLATHLIRTQMLSAGHPLSAVTERLSRALGISTRIVPMTDDRMATMVDTVEHGTLGFQEYFVGKRWQPTVRRVWYDGEESAQPARGVTDALDAADLIVFAPSNPVLSVEPILRVRGIRAALESRRVPCIAVSPVLAGTAFKGPTVKLMAELGLEPTAAGVAAYYGSLIDAYVLDPGDVPDLGTLGSAVLATDIRMPTSEERVRLAGELLAWASKQYGIKG